jgi:hypothetical protein
MDVLHKKLIVGLKSGVLQLWNAETSTMIDEMPGKFKNIISLALLLSTDDKCLAIVSDISGETALIDFSKILLKIPSHNKQVIISGSSNLCIAHIPFRK